MMSLLVFILLCLASAAFSVENRPRAETENGPVVGTYMTSYSGYKFKAFKGIPYAKPPVGEHRFKEAKPLTEKWVGEWKADEYGSSCLQYDSFTRDVLDDGTFNYQVTGDEDCLFLNVFTQEGGPAKKNVVFMIHGGAFMFGNSHTYGPEYMMDQEDIVYVTPNYRLGPLGFMTTGDDVIPGNNGLKDQIVALQWVQRNIANFGGDPNKVTISGMSAGGASVDYLMLSPLSEGLFQKGYSFSGSSLCPWALVKNGAQRTEQIAQHLGCPTTDSRSILKCLRRRPARQIVEAVSKLLVWRYNPFTVFGPVIEVNSARPFIDRHPRTILRLGLNKQLPWIGGVTTEDGLYPAAEYILDETILKQIEDKWNEIGSALLFLNPQLSQKSTQDNLNLIRNHYFGDRPIDKANVEAFVRLLTERDFTAGIAEAAKLRKDGYLYLFGYQGATSASHVISGTKEPMGACHADDFGSIVQFTFVPSHTTKRDIEMAAVIKKIFFSFVRSGKVPEEFQWKPYSSSNSYLKIESPEDITIMNESILDLELQKSLFETEVNTRDEL